MVDAAVAEARPDHGQRRDQSRRLTGREHDRGQLGPAVDRVAASRAPPDTNRHPSRLQLGQVALYGADAYAKPLCQDLPGQLAGCPYSELLDQCVEAFDPGDEGLDAQHATTLTDRARHAFVWFVTAGQVTHVDAMHVQSGPTCQRQCPLTTELLLKGANLCIL